MCNDIGKFCGSALSIETNLFVFVVSSSSGSKVLLDLTDREKYVGYFSFYFICVCLLDACRFNQITVRIRSHASTMCQQQT